MAELKFTPVFRVSTRIEAEEKLKELRAQAIASGWKERSSYILPLPEGGFKVVFKQVKECKEN
jgi:hypothetical protein